MIDAHVHVTEDGRWFHTDFDASVDRLLREMDRAGVARSVLLPIPGVIGNRALAAIRDRHPDRLIGFGSIDLEASATVEEQLEEVTSLGLRGLKVHPRLQGLRPDDRRLEPIYEGAVERGQPLVICGWQQSPRPEVPLDSIEPYAFDRIAKRHPRLNLVIAHLGGHRPLDAYFVAKSNPNVYLDASYTLQALRETSIYQDLRFVLRHLDRKVIFGSDFPEMSIPEYVADFREALRGLEDVDVEAITSENILSLMGDTR